MIFGATHSRAAFLCMGGWGLQVMLHLAPRLRAAQEQRAACGVDAPDLTRITRFATLLPLLHADPDGHVPIQLRTLREDVTLPPFYLESVLGRLEKSAWAASWRDFYTGKDPNGARQAHQMFQSQTLRLTATSSSRQALALLQATDPVLQAVPWPGGAPHMDPSRNGPPATRRQVFRTALDRGADLAPLLTTYLIDPIRQDELAPGDPFVQTTLYVIAPLYEPLTSPLIWPTVAHLLAYLGPRHVAQVVGIFALGSYAQDASRRVEDAAAAAALAELEALSGQTSAGQEAVRGLVDVPELHDRVGRPLFDRIYLVDREKTNQGLVGHSFELTALVANGLQALIEADGLRYIEDQIGIDLRDARRRPYSLMGAATDAMPLDYLFQELHQDEERRLIREQICPEPPPDPPADRIGLDELGATPRQILAHLVTRLPDLFRHMEPAHLAELEVNPDFVLPRPLARELRDLDPDTWLAEFEAHLETVQAELEALLAETRLDQAWGVDEPTRDPGRLVPLSGQRMRALVAEILAAGPDSLPRARHQVAAWLRELRAGREQLLSGFSPGQVHLRQAQIEMALRAWRTRYAAARGARTSLAGTLLRATLLILAVVAAGAGYMVALGGTPDPVMDGSLLVGFGLGSYAGGIVHYRRRRLRLHALRRERAELARQALTLRLQERIYHGLSRVYDALETELRTLDQALATVQERLTAWAQAQTMPPVPPPHVRTTHLYRLHLDERTWRLCRDYLAERTDTHGRRLVERLQHVWADPAWRQTLQQVLAGRTSPDASLAVELEERIRGQVRQAVAELSPLRAPQVRQALIRLLADRAHIEHVLWRREGQEEGGKAGVPLGWSGLLPTHRARIESHLAGLWTLAKPAANYDVADRLAAPGVEVAFAAVSGREDSDLSEAILRELRLTHLATGNPFHITLVRTVHGLRLDNLESMRRYRAELVRLGPGGWQAILLGESGQEALYSLVGRPSPSRPPMWE